MNRTEFIEALAEKTGFSKKDAGTACKAFLEVIEEELEKDGKVNFIGFGNFSTVIRSGRLANIPGSTEKINIPETTVVKFKVGKTLRDKIGQNK